MITLVYARYRDVGEPKPRYGGELFTCRRQVTNIQTVASGETGIIQYKGRLVPVYRRSGSSSWETDPAVLGPIKITYLH